MSDQMTSSGPSGNGAAPATDPVFDVTTQAFARDVLEASRTQPVLVDFWAPWCGPCKQLSPIIEKTVRAARGAVKLAKMNIDEHPSVASQLGIQSIPAVIAFVDGRPADGFVGAVPESQVKAFIERIAGAAGPGAEAAAMLDEAEAALEAGEINGAAQLFKAALELNPEEVRALAGLARCAIEVGELDKARQALSMIPESKAAEPSVAAARARLELAEQAGKLGDSAELEARIAANPADHQARFDLALIKNAGGQREEAVDQLLEIMRRDRNWNDEQARKQLLQFFEAWGPADEATLSGRRRLSSILFA